MQLEHEIADSRYLSGDDFALVWDNFPHQASICTWDVITYNNYATPQGPAFSCDHFDAQRRPRPLPPG
jgi:alkaline phosphatase